MVPRYSISLGPESSGGLGTPSPQAQRPERGSRGATAIRACPGGEAFPGHSASLPSVGLNRAQVWNGSRLTVALPQPPGPHAGFFRSCTLGRTLCDCGLTSRDVTFQSLSQWPSQAGPRDCHLDLAAQKAGAPPRLGRLVVLPSPPHCRRATRPQLAGRQGCPGFCPGRSFLPGSQGDSRPLLALPGAGSPVSRSHSCVRPPLWGLWSSSPCPTAALATLPLSL